jgi:hypothetical protein
MHPSNFGINPGTGHAFFRAENHPMADYHDVVNALTGGPSVPGRVTFNVEWEKSYDRHIYRYEPHRWQGEFVHNSATCTWSGRTAAAEFVTNTVNPVIFAEVGHERSGVFFS